MGIICSICSEDERKPGAIIDTKTAEENLPPKGTSFSSVTARFILPLDISKRHPLEFDSGARFDFSARDYKAFCLLLHRKHGGLLLHCTRKKKKPPHYQLPGGHIDHDDFRQITGNLNRVVTQQQLYYAARLGCAREIYEETKIDFRNRLGELHPMILYETAENRDSENAILINEYKSRIFFVCEVFDDDFPDPEREGGMRFSSTRYTSLPSDFSCDLMLQLSVEHSGFCFFKNSLEISKNLKYHSGGKVEKAVTMAYSLVNQ